MTSRRKIVLVSGWRGIAHSYAIVNQFQCLELLRREDVQLFFDDAPFFNPNWQRVSGLFDAADDAAIAGLPDLPSGVRADVEFRISAPYDLANSTRAERTFVFGTAEVGYVPDSYIAGQTTLAEAHGSPGNATTIITPSKWSADGFLNSGADAERIKVVPHGVDLSTYCPPTIAERAEARRKHGIADDEFVFLHIGAMSANKNVSMLLSSFAAVQKLYSSSRLLLKGTDSVFQSKSFYMSHVLQALRDEDLRPAISRISYIGDTLSFTEMASLYHAADCYVAPYSAEGFNLPVLEATASGLPIICTAGGPTDEFTDKDFALYIRSRIDTEQPKNTSSAEKLIPDAIHLKELMTEAIENQDFREQASDAGPGRVSRDFTWQRVVDRLLEVLRS